MNAPPPTLTTERLLLGCILRDPAATMPMLAATLRPEHFREYPHQVLYASCVELHAEGGTLDLETVYDDLGRKKRRADLGPRPVEFMAEVFQSVLTATDFADHAEAVREAWRLRQFDMAMDRLRLMATNGAPTSLLVSNAEEQFRAIAADVDAVPRPEPFPFMDTLAFLKADFRQESLVDHVLVRGQPAVGGGPMKCLKTGFGADLAISIASGRPFLDKFRVPAPARVVMVSGESGGATLQETCRRIMGAKGIDAEDVADRLQWCLELPRFPDRANTRTFCQKLKKYGADVAILDPVYQCVGGEVDHANVYAMGDLFKLATAELLAVGTTPLLLHHATKRLQLGATMTLGDLAYSGLAEFARQWILVNRLTEYQGDGVHEIRMSVGGSAGHSGLWDVHVEEGTADAEFQGRYWRVEVKSAAEARADGAAKKERAKEEKRRQQETDDEQKVMNAIDAEVGATGTAATQGKIKARCPNLSGTKVGAILERLLEHQLIDREPVEVKSGRGKGRTETFVGYRRADRRFNAVA